jgi:hypothetical protein
MTDDYEIPTGDTGHEPGTFLMVLTALKPFMLYETRNGWTREKPEDSHSIVESYNKIEWVFADDEGVTGSGSTSTARSERSTLFAWATGLGVPPAVVLDRSKPIPSGQLVGREAMVTFAPDKNGYSRITSVVPVPRARAAQPVAANSDAVSQPGGAVREIVPPQPTAPNPTPAPAEVPAGAEPTGDALPF